MLECSLMKARVKRMLATMAWLLAATLGLLVLWGNNPDVVPWPPEGFWIWLCNLVGVRNGVGLVRLEVLFMVAASNIAASLITLVGWFIVRNLRRHSAQTPDVQV